MRYVQRELAGGIIKTYPTGHKVCDWKVPKEWQLKTACIKTVDGDTILDASENILHVVNYSCPISGVFKTADIIHRIHYSETLPEAIPYRTSYYVKDWGFCCTKEDFDRISQLEEVIIEIDTQFIDSELEVLEYIVQGQYDKEILFSSYTCHPNMANDSLSGVILNLELAKALSKRKCEFTYRFVFLPETIGPIAYLSDHSTERIEYAIVSTTCGLNKNGYQVKLPFDLNSVIYHSVKNLVYEEPVKFFDFDIHGSDERQYSSPGVRIPTASLHRGKYYEYPEYHTDLDNTSIVSGLSIYKSFRITCQLLSVLENSLKYTSGISKGEPFLSSKGLYNSLGGSLNPSRVSDLLDSILWVYWFVGEQTTFEAMADKAKVPVTDIVQAFNVLKEKNLLEQYTATRV